MGVLKLNLKLNCPAFLGDAHQEGAWRTPPLKALLRHWWRVAVAAQTGFQVESLREREGRLFGHAFLGKSGQTWACRSQVHLRLGEWRPGTLGQWGRDPKVEHREVQRGEVGAHLYLGYGPLTYRKGGTALKSARALDAGDSVELTIRYPRAHCQELQLALLLMARFGTLGGRSRNGWGSFELAPAPDATWTTRPLSECLQLDWPHAIGNDARGALIWKSEKSYPDWRQVMENFARLKIEIRTEFDPGGRDQFQERHLLAYPVTNHRGGLKPTDRMANQLRFKVRQSRKGLEMWVVHLPHRCSLSLNRAQRGFADSHEHSVWTKVHEILDECLVRQP